MRITPSFLKSGLGSLALVLVVGMFLPSAYSRLDQGAISTPTPSASQPASRPTLSPIDEEFWQGATLVEGDEVERYLWDETSVDFSGLGIVPMSFTIGNFDGSVQIYAEFRNTTNKTLIVPTLYFEAILDDKSFGEKHMSGDQHEVLAGETATYRSSSMYDGAVLLGDWDTFKISLFEYAPYFDLSTQGLSLDIDDRRIHNNGDVDKENVAIEAIMRDAEGVFIGTCNRGLIGATIPAGLSVRVPSDILLSVGPDFVCTNEGAESFAERLGTSPISTTELFIDILW